MKIKSAKISLSINLFIQLIIFFKVYANEEIPFESVKNNLSYGVHSITSNYNGYWKSAFAAVMDNGSVVTWGNVSKGAHSMSVSDKLNNVSSIASNSYAFAALRQDGSVVTWGDESYGGNSSIISSTWEKNPDGSYYENVKTLKNVVNDLQSGVVKIVPNKYAFAALKSDGSVVTWGVDWLGGEALSGWYWFGEQENVSDKLKSGVINIYSNYQAFAALKQDGSVVTWGHPWGGAKSYNADHQLEGNVISISATRHAFAALKKNGSVITWGRGYDGGYATKDLADKLNSDVMYLCSSRDAFAALKKDGSVVTWGYFNQGGNSSAVESKLSTGVIEIYATDLAFAALKSDGSVVTWGDYDDQFLESLDADLAADVIKLVASGDSFAVLKKNSSVIKFGHYSFSDKEIINNVNRLDSDGSGFTALKNDGTLVAWNLRNSEEFSGAIEKVLFAGNAIGAKRVDGSVLWLGSNGFTGSGDYIAGGGGSAPSGGSGEVKKSKKGGKGKSTSAKKSGSGSKKSTISKSSGGKKSGAKKKKRE